MRFRCLLGLTVTVVACGGSDVVIPDGGGDDGAAADSGTPADGAASDSGVADANPSDSGAPDTGADSGGWSVANVPGLALWLDAAKGITKNGQNQVSQWNDQSGNGNHATQGLSARQPIATASVINGQPTVRFAQGQTNGMVMNVADSSTLRWGQGDWLIEVVARFDNNPASGTGTRAGLFWAKFPTGMANTPGVIFLANNPLGMTPSTGLTGGIINANAFVGVTTVYNDNAARVFAYRRVGNTLELRVGGAPVATQNLNGNPNVDAMGTVVHIGADFDATTNRLNGDVAEMIAVKGTISAQDLGNIEGYLKGRYGL